MIDQVWGKIKDLWMKSYKKSHPFLDGFFIL